MSDETGVLPERLGDDDFERWLKRSEQDPAASEELDFQADLVAALERERARAARPSVLVTVRRRSHARRWTWVAAASVLLAAALVLWFRREPPQALRVSDLAQRSPPLYVAAELRSPDAPVASAFPSAMERYSAGDWAGARRGLEECLERSPGHGPTRFYLAACLEQLGDLDRAASEYRRVAEEQPGFLGEHGRWRLVQVLLQGGDVAGAKSELARLAEGNGTFAPNAREQLSALASVAR